MRDNVPYTEAERAVCNHLLPGQEHAITIRELQILTRLGPRTIKHAVHGLRVRHGLLVCGEKSGARRGYYLPDTAWEHQRAFDLLMDQAISMIVAARVSRTQVVIREKLGQLRLAIDGLEAA